MTAVLDIEQALKAIKGGKPELAEAFAREQLSLHPASIDHLRLLGRALMRQRQYGEAEAQLRKAVERSPDAPFLLEELGRALIQQRKFDEAIPVFRQVVRLDPERANAHKKLGQALAAVGRGKEADEAFKVFFEKDPDMGAVAIGAEHLRAGREDEAIKSFRQALRDSPDNVDAMRFLAAIYLKKGKEGRKLGDAEALLLRATQIAPNFSGAWFDLGNVLLKRSKRLDAIEAFRQTTVLEPRNANAWERLASITAAAGYPEEAEKAFSKAIDLTPKAAGFHMGHGHTLKTLGDQPAALRA